jgi:NAD(P)-dependent dehydrogenase (short-subunit alcohol dehydrogenase family)
MERLAGRTAVVTGGGSGIGRGIALALAGEGVHVAVADIEPQAAEGVAAEVRACGVRSLAAPSDVTRPESLRGLAARVERILGSVHVLVNCAGVVHERGTLAERTDDDWLWVFSVNLHGVVRSVQVFLPALRAHGDEAHIVNTASMAGLVAVPDLGIGIYTASKYACVGYSEILRQELAPLGIGVSVLCPGMVESNLARTSARNRPAEYGGPLAEPGETPADVRAQMMPAEECGRIVVRGIRENRLHILTHPGTRPLVEARFRQILADYDAEEHARGRRAKG